MLQKISCQRKIICLILRKKYQKDGIEFFSPPEFSQQLAYMNRPQGYKIDAHIHNKVHRKVYYTQEVLFIKSGKIKIDFYSDERKYFSSEVLEAGDTILLASGGHGFTFLEPSEIIEVKQGPYAGEKDKEKFRGIE